jgi:hypothetical protein
LAGEGQRFPRKQEHCTPSSDLDTPAKGMIFSPAASYAKAASQVARPLKRSIELLTPDDLLDLLDRTLPLSGQAQEN